MLGFQSNSLANPIGGSSSFDFGTKEVASFLTFSIGDQASGDEYITKSSNGDDVTITIKDKVATFSFPQTHPYIGVGDKVSFSYYTYFLNKKISSTQWEVHNGINHVNNIEDETIVTKIDKAYPGIEAVISGDSPAILSLTGRDLVAINSVLRIALYTKDTNETINDSINIKAWTNTDESHFIRIFVPSNIATECNSSQRHKGNDEGNTYKIIGDSANSLFALYNDYTEIEGLIIDGNSRSDNAIIDYSAIGLRKTKILNNILSNAKYGIYSSQLPLDNQVVVGNIIYGMIDGINLNNKLLNAYNNTIVDFTNIGINLTANVGDYSIKNCLIQKGTTGSSCFSEV